MANIGFFCGEMATFSLSAARRNKNAHNGGLEPFLFLQVLANNNPENTYYVIMRCADYKKYSEEQYAKDFIHHNVVFIGNKYDEKYNGAFKTDNLYGREMNPKIVVPLEEMTTELETIGIDYFISHNMIRTSTIPGRSRVIKNPEKLSLGMSSSNRYTMLGLYFVNKFNKPYFATNIDFRFLKPVAYSLTNAPKAIFSHINSTMTFNLLEELSYEAYFNGNRKEHKVPIVYNGIDLLALVSLDPLKIEPTKKSGLALYLNQHPSSSYDRYSCMKKYILDSGIDVEIEVYGKWHKTHPETQKDSRFKGDLTRNEMLRNMEDKKYTFIVPSNDGVTLASLKVWESIHTGVIPFLHNSYGGHDWREFHKLPEWLWVSNPEDLKSKIDYLENNPEVYQKALYDLSGYLTKSHYDGSYLNTQIQNSINFYLKGC